MFRTLEVTVDIEEKGGKVIKYAYKANKLPGDIDPDGCKTEASRHRVTDPQPVIFVSIYKSFRPAIGSVNPSLYMYIQIYIF